MALAAGTTLLGGRYRLIKSPIASAGEAELWVGIDEEEWAKPYLVKVWPFPDAKPDDVQRALWDAELRTLYRVRSTRSRTVHCSSSRTSASITTSAAS